MDEDYNYNDDWLLLTKLALPMSAVICLCLILYFWPWLSMLVSKPTISNEMVPMYDGVKMATDTYLPATSGKFPTILVRSPYGKKVDLGKILVGRKKLALVIQDTKGKYSSAGKFYAFRDERHGGLATIEWLRKKPWFNGQVIGFGMSYPAIACWAIIDELHGAVVIGGCRDGYDVLYPGGLFSLQTAVRWAFSVDGQKNAMPSAEVLDQACNILPLSEADEKTYATNKFWDDWLAHPTRDEYWNKMTNRLSPKGPVLSVAGWYDIFLYAQLKDFLALKGCKKRCKLIIGPWAHGPFAAKIDFGEKQHMAWALEKVAPFFNEILAKKKTAKDLNKPFTLFVMQKNEWVEAESWPPHRTTMTPMYMSAVGRLNYELPTKSSVKTFDYDPADPMPSIGGTALGNGVGPGWQNKNEGRKDCLLFTTAVLSEPMTLLGPLQASLYVESDAPQTDFIVLLQDEYPDGRILNIQEGGRTVRTAGGGVKRADVDIWATGYQVKAGHRLRAVITSSWFPRFNRSPNTGAGPKEAVELRKANQKIHLGGEKPSHLILPLFK